MSLLREAQRCLDNHALHTARKAFVNVAQRNAVLEQVQNAERSGRQEPLNGRLVAIKDNICTSDLPTTAASRILETFRSPYDATVASKLRRAGAVVVGKTNLDEFGMGSHSTHSYFGAVSQAGGSNGERALSAGGSSGGSAIAVATDQCWAALGTDTGGSVRLPAAYSGVVGFKPSYGRLSRWGVIAYANSLDTVGVLSKSTEDARSIFDVLDEYDPKDPTSLAPLSRSRLQELAHRSGRGSSQRLRIGVPKEYNIQELDSSVREAWLHTLQALQKQGHTIHSVSLPTTRHALSAYYILAPAEASSNLAKYDGVRYGTRAPPPDGDPSSVLFANTRGQGFGDEVKRRILLGAYSLSAQTIDNYFIQAQKIRRLVQRDFDAAFKSQHPLSGPEGAAEAALKSEGVDVLICPTAPSLPPSLEEAKVLDPVHAYMNDVFTVPASLAGLPAVSVPVASRESQLQSESGSIGIQVIGQFGHDQLVLDVGQIIEQI